MGEERFGEDELKDGRRSGLGSRFVGGRVVAYSQLEACVQVVMCTVHLDQHGTVSAPGFAHSVC